MTAMYGIITFHKAHNYGALLQAYALKKSIEKIVNCDVYFIDYQHKKLALGYKLYPELKDKCGIKGILSFIKGWSILLLDFNRKRNRYISFSKFINRYIKCIDFSNEIIKLDALILGSDQIWNSKYTNGVDSVYYGSSEFIVADKVISYAASMGLSEINKEDESYFVSLINKIDFIGVRETHLKDYINKKSSKKVALNLDPTLLLDKSEWREIESPRKITDEYLLVYEVQEHPSTMSIANYISKKLGLRVINLAARTGFKTSRNSITDASPEDFLSLFSNASFIVTTSFHGTVFSIINKKQFYTLKFSNDIDIRSSCLLGSVNLTSRHINSIPDFVDFNNIDYDDVDEKLSEYRRESLFFLESSMIENANSSIE